MPAARALHQNGVTIMERRVRILAGLPEMIGKTGKVIGKEGKMLRVRFDTPIYIEGIGEVFDDLWEPRLLKTISGSNVRFGF